MKLKTLFGFWALGLGAAFADNAVSAASAEPAKAEKQAIETPASQANASADADKKAPEAAGENSPTQPNFNVLHGSAYNTVSNEAAAANVDGLRPDQYYGKKFLYIEPAGERGVISLGSLFAALDISGDLGRMTLGYATNGFGIALHAALGQFHASNDNGEQHQTEAGDDLGLAVSKVLGKYAVSAKVDWNTYAKETGVDPEYGKSSTENFRDLNVNVGITNSPSAGKVSWTFSLGFLRHENNTESAGKSFDENGDSYVQITPAFNIGALGLENKHARVFVGLNSSVPIVLFDEYADNVDGESEVNASLSEYGLSLSPNILGEVFLRNDILIFGEASYDWLAFGFGSGTDENGEDYSVIQSKMNKVNATMGFRYQLKDFFAAEFAFGDSFFTDTKSIFNGEGTFVSFGAFLYF